MTNPTDTDRAKAGKRPDGVSPELYAAALLTNEWEASELGGGNLRDRIAAALTETRAVARRDQQLWDRRRVEHYADVVGVELTPGDDLGDAINELYLAARAPYDRLTAGLRALAEEVAAAHGEAKANARASREPIIRNQYIGRAWALGDVLTDLRAVVAAAEENR